jgi:hypothetical protein
VDLGLLHAFVTVNCLGVWSLAPRSTPNLEDQGLHFVWLLPFDLSGMSGLPAVYAPTSIAPRVIGARGPPLHDRAVVLKDVFISIGHLLIQIITGLFLTVHLEKFS